MVIRTVPRAEARLAPHTHRCGVIPEVGLEALAEPSPNRMDQRDTMVRIATITLPPLLIKWEQKQGTKRTGVARPSKVAKQSGQQGVKRVMTGTEKVH